MGTILGTVLKCRRRDWLNQPGFSVSKDGRFPVPKLVEEPGARTAPFHVVVNWRMPSPKPRRTSVRMAVNTLEAGARTTGRFRSTRGAVGCDEPEHVAAHGPHLQYHGDASAAPLKAEERTKGARPPNEDRRYGELRLSIAQVGRRAPPSKSISMSVREFANAGNVITVLRSVVSITS